MAEPGAPGDTFAVAALVRKRAEMAGRIAHARDEMESMLASLAALDATLRLFGAAVEPENIRPRPFRPADAEPRLGMVTRDVLRLMREAGQPLTAGELATRLLTERGRGATEEAMLHRTTQTVRKTLARHRARGAVVSEAGQGQLVLWRLAEGWAEVTPPQGPINPDDHSL